MNLRSLQSLHLIALFAVSVGITGSITSVLADPPLRLRSQVTTATPSPEVVTMWEKQFIEEELIRFSKRVDWERFRNRLAPYPELLSLVEKNSFFIGHQNTEKILRLQKSYRDFDYKTGTVVVVLFLDSETRARIPEVFMKELYEMQSKTHPNRPIWARFYTWEAVLDFLRDSQVPDAYQKRITASVIEIDGLLEVPIRPDTWKFHSEHMRKRLVAQVIENNKKRAEGYDVWITLQKNDDLNSIAKHFAGNQDPSNLLKLMKEKLGHLDQVELPLSELLPPFIQQYLGRFVPYHWINCANAGLNVNCYDQFRVDFTSADDLMHELNTKYVAIRRGEELRAGDLLLYRNLDDGKFRHVSTYLTDQFAFTKNGQHRMRPYVIQMHPEVEDGYFKDGELQLEVFRLKSSIDSSPPNDFAGKDQTPYFQGKVRYGSKFSERMGRTDGCWRLLDLIKTKNSSI